jgi:hypothetical protein
LKKDLQGCCPAEILPELSCLPPEFFPCAVAHRFSAWSAARSFSCWSPCCRPVKAAVFLPPVIVSHCPRLDFPAWISARVLHQSLIRFTPSPEARTRSQGLFDPQFRLHAVGYPVAATGQFRGFDSSPVLDFVAKSKSRLCVICCRCSSWCCF